MKKLFYLLAVSFLSLFNVSYANSAFVVTNMMNNSDEIKFQMNVRSIDQAITITEYNNEDGTIYLVLTGYQNKLSPTIKDLITASSNHVLVNELIVQTTEARPNELSIKISPKVPISYLVYHKDNQLFFDLRAQATSDAFSFTLNEERNKFFEKLHNTASLSTIFKAKMADNLIAFTAENFSVKDSITLMAEWNRWNVYQHKNITLLSEEPISTPKSTNVFTEQMDEISLSFKNISAHPLTVIVADFSKKNIYFEGDSNMSVYIEKEPWGHVLEAIAILEGMSLSNQSNGIYFEQ